jgi:hypothetical protein
MSLNPRHPNRTSGRRRPNAPGLRPGRASNRTVTIAVLAAGLAAALLPGPSLAGDSKYAGEFLRLGVGGRALGMGGGFVGIADDASAAYWNPAGLASLGRAEMLFMHSEQFASLANHDYIGFVQPLPSGTGHSAVGIGLIRFSVDNIQITRDAYQDLDHNGQWDPGEPIMTDQFRTDSDTEYCLLLSYARAAADHLLLGGSAKLIRQGLLDNTSFGMGLDLGLLYRLRSDLRLGARLANATTTRISWDTGRRETIMPSLDLGLSWTRKVEALNGTLTAGLGLANSFENRQEASQVSGGMWGGELQGGLEYWYGRSVAARVGSDAGHLAAGAGLRYHSLGADYAYLAHEDLGATHRVSASVGL